MAGLVELGKQYQTRDGRAVTVFYTAGAGLWCVYGMINTGGQWFLHTWLKDGRHANTGVSDADLIENRSLKNEF